MNVTSSRDRSHHVTWTPVKQVNSTFILHSDRSRILWAGNQRQDGSARVQVQTEGILVFQLLHCALSLAVQCIVIGPVCVFACLQRAGGRCPNLTTASARAVFCVSLSAFFINIRSCTAFLSDDSPNFLLTQITWKELFLAHRGPPRDPPERHM